MQRHHDLLHGEATQRFVIQNESIFNDFSKTGLQLYI